MVPSAVNVYVISLRKGDLVVRLVTRDQALLVGDLLAREKPRAIDTGDIRLAARRGSLRRVLRRTQPGSQKNCETQTSYLCPTCRTPSKTPLNHRPAPFLSTTNTTT